MTWIFYISLFEYMSYYLLLKLLRAGIVAAKV